MWYTVILLFIIFHLGFSAFFQEYNVSRFDISHLTRNVAYSKDEKIVVLHKYANEYVLLGARNRVYNISLNSMSEIDRYEWDTNESTKQNCGEISQQPSACENYIRTYFELTNSSFILCGTHGLQPTCAEFQIGNRKPIRLISAVGMSPVDSDATSPFIRSSENIITVNVAELSSSEPLLIRRNVIKMWKGIENDVILRTPRGQGSFEQATFLSMHKVKNEVMFFFSESPMDWEGCGLHKVARVGRVCDDDQGGRMSYSKEWSSYAKARIECSIEEQDEDTFYFNQFASVTESPTAFYGAFRSQLAGIGASAICKYEKQYISTTMSNAYKNSNKDTCPRANDVEELTKLRVNPLIRQRIVAHPMYIFHGKDKFTHVIAQENVQDLGKRVYDILYIATNLGNILKVVVPKGENMSIGRHALTLRVLPPSTKIVDMSIFTEKLPNNMTYDYLIITTDRSILKVPTTTCNLASSCAECLSTSDPQCAWADAGECIDIRAERMRTRYSRQDTATCDMNYDRKPVSLAPLKPKNEPACLCETTTSIPCTTEVIQKEIIQYSKSEIPKYLGCFAVGLAIGSIFNCLYLYFSRNNTNRGMKTMGCFPGYDVLTSTSTSSQKYDARVSEKPSSIRSTSITRPITPHARIDAFTSSSIADDMFNSAISAGRYNTNSMHSSIRTYC